MKIRNFSLIFLAICIFICFGFLNTLFTENSDNDVLSEEDILNGIDNAFMQEDYQALADLYDKLIEHYPSVANLIYAGRFAAQQGNHEYAHEIWQRILNNPVNDYRIVEREYYSEDMVPYLMEIYLDIIYELSASDFRTIYIRLLQTDNVSEAMILLQQYFANPEREQSYYDAEYMERLLDYKLSNNDLSEINGLLGTAQSENMLTNDVLHFYSGWYSFLNQDFENATAELNQVESYQQERAYMLNARSLLATGDYDAAAQRLSNVEANEYTAYYLCIALICQDNFPVARAHLENFILNYSSSQMMPDIVELYRTAIYTMDDEQAKSDLIEFISLTMTMDYPQAIDFAAQASDEPYNQRVNWYYITSVADIYILQQDYQSAEEYLASISSSEIQDEFYLQKISFMLGSLYINHLDRIDEGSNILLGMIRQYPDSSFLFKIRKLLG